LAWLAHGTGLTLVATCILGAARCDMSLERATVVVGWFGSPHVGAVMGGIAAESVFARAAASFGVEWLHATMSYAAIFTPLASARAISAMAAPLAARHL
jgi:hypothetical protein